MLLDANLLLLYVVGSHNVALVGSGRLSAYTVTDFLRVQDFVEAFSKLITTAHILTEVSNLLGNFLAGERRVRCFEAFAADIVTMQEVASSSQDAALRKEFRYLGLTDCVIANLAGQFFVLSSDARMVATLQEADLDAVNFNHFRDELQRIVRLPV